MIRKWKWSLLTQFGSTALYPLIRGSKAVDCRHMGSHVERSVYIGMALLGRDMQQGVAIAGAPTLLREAKQL